MKRVCLFVCFHKRETAKPIGSNFLWQLVTVNGRSNLKKLARKKMATSIIFEKFNQTIDEQIVYCKYANFSATFDDLKPKVLFIFNFRLVHQVFTLLQLLKIILWYTTTKGGEGRWKFITTLNGEISRSAS